MYTLRKVTPNGVESNMALGSSYNVVQAESSIEEFERTFNIVYTQNEVFFTKEQITGDLENDKKHFWPIAELAYQKGFRNIYAYNSLYDLNSENEVKPVEGFGSVYAFIVSEGGKEIYPLFKNQRNYIMTDSGKTFSNLSLK